MFPGAVVYRMYIFYQPKMKENFSASDDLKSLILKMLF